MNSKLVIGSFFHMHNNINLQKLPPAVSFGSIVIPLFSHMWNTIFSL